MLVRNRKQRGHGNFSFKESSDRTTATLLCMGKASCYKALFTDVKPFQSIFVSYLPPQQLSLSLLHPWTFSSGSSRTPHIKFLLPSDKHHKCICFSSTQQPLMPAPLLVSPLYIPQTEKLIYFYCRARASIDLLEVRPSALSPPCLKPAISAWAFLVAPGATGNLNNTLLRGWGGIFPRTTP